MSGLLRAILWAGLYFGVVLLPLAAAAIADPIAGGRPFAVELAAATGFIGYSLLACEFALVSRQRGASAPFGTDALMLFHRQMGIAALGFVLVHVGVLWARSPSLGMFNPLAGSMGIAAGAAAFWGLLLLVATSLWRRRLWISYETWRTLHVLFSIVAVGGALLHLLALGPYTRAPVVRGAVLVYTALFGTLLTWYRVVRPLRLWRRPWEVVENREESGSTRTLAIRPVGHRGLTFEPGQFAWLCTGRTPFGLEQHPLSLSSSAEIPADGRIEFSVKALGDWSRDVLPTLAPGTRVWVDGPFGAFTLDRVPGQGFVMIAGGIGIAPLRSMLLTMRDRGDPRPVLLFHASSSPTRAIFREELAGLGETIDLRIVNVYEEAVPGAEHGYLTPEMLHRHLPSWWRHGQFFVCGPGAMMDAVEGILRGIGVGDDRIQTERFDMV